MKHLKRLVAVLLVGILTLSMLTACTKSQTDSEKAAELTNLFLKGRFDLSATVKADTTLEKDASDYAAILKQFVAISSGTSQDDAKFETNYAVNEKLNDLEGDIYSSKKQCWLVGKYDRLLADDYDDEGDAHLNVIAENDEQIAWGLVCNLNYLLGEPGTEYTQDKGADEPVASELVGIGIARVTDVNEPVWVETDETDDDGDVIYEMESTRKFTGWVVVVSYK